MAAAMEPTQDPGADGGRSAPDLETVRAAFPQFEVVELIGRGGMGAVYKVRQPQLDRYVALKILTSPPGADSAFAERFQREGKALARLSHPHIVTIHDFGEAGGFFYLLMEFVDGVNLRQAICAGRFTSAQALAVVPPICEALQYAHERGIVHRDIKPENLLLDKSGRLKIADFGIAMIMEGADEPPPSVPSSAGAGEGLTQGHALGTPQYMAPEQRASSSSPVDHRADIYSLGVVLYELLTGELPSTKLEAPSRRVHIDVRLDEIVLRALEAQPERRYSTAFEFKTQVESVAVTKEPSGGPAPGAESRSKTEGMDRESSGTVRRKRRRWLIGLVFFLPILITLASVAMKSNQYFAKVTMEVKMDSDPLYRDRGGFFGREDSSFVAQQCEILQTPDILNQTIDQLHLMKEFSGPGESLDRSTVNKRLKRMMVVQEVRNTGLIEIGIYDVDPQRAARIANTLALVYQQKRRSDLERGIDQLRDEVEQLRKQVAETAAKATQIRTEAGISDPNSDSAEVVLNVSPDKKSALQDYVDAKNRYLQARKILESVEVTLTAEKLRVEASAARMVRIWERAEAPAHPVAGGFFGWRGR